MTTRLFTDLERKITPTAPGCPQPVIKQHVRDAAIAACKATLAWRYEQDPIPLTPGVYTYEYETPEDSEVVAIFQTSLNDLVFPAVSLDVLLARFPAWPATATTDRAQPAVVSQFDTDHFVVAPVPDDVDTYTIKMFLALRPTQDADGMDKTIFDELEELIMHGALFRILSIPEQSWSNGKLAEFHGKQTTYKTSMQRAVANLGAGRASLRVRPVPFS